MVISPVLVGRVPIHDATSGLAPGWRMLTRRPSPHVAVRSDTELRVVALDFELGKPRCRAVFPAPWPAWRSAPDAVAPDLSFAVFSGQHAVRAVDPDGALRWEYAHDCWGCGDLESGSVIVTADGRHVWATAPSPHGGTWQYDGDEWIVFDAVDGTVVAKAGLDCAAAGSSHLLHPDGVRVGLWVGEGQDGTPSYWGHLDGDTVTVAKVGEAERDRVLVDVAPDGHGFLTVHHYQGDLAVHHFPGVEVAASIDATALVGPGEQPPDDAVFDHDAGYLSAEKIIAVVDQHDAQHRRHWVLDTRTAQPLGPIAYQGSESEVSALGDGTWLTGDGEHIYRWAIP